MQSTGSVDRAPSPARLLAASLGAVVAVLAGLAAGAPALIALNWRSDGGPVTGIAAVVPAAASAGLLRLLVAGDRRGSRTAAVIVLGAVGFAVWTVAVIAAFQTQSAYSSTTGTGGTGVGWVVAGGLGALVAVASSALLPQQRRTAGWSVASAAVVAVWLVFAVARSIDGTVVLGL